MSIGIGTSLVIIAANSAAGFAARTNAGRLRPERSLPGQTGPPGP